MKAFTFLWGTVISRGQKISEEKRTQILRVLTRDPDHNASRTAKKIGVSRSTVNNIAKAAGIALMGRGGNFSDRTSEARDMLSRRMKLLWNDPESAEYLCERMRYAKRKVKAKKLSR